MISRHALAWLLLPLLKQQQPIYRAAINMFYVCEGVSYADECPAGQTKRKASVAPAPEYSKCSLTEMSSVSDD